MSPVSATLSVEIGAQLDHLETRLRTITPGKIKVGKGITVDARHFGPTTYISREEYYGDGAHSDEPIRLNDGQEVEYLQYRAEGYCFIQVERNVVESDIIMYFGEANLVLMKEPVVEWWIYLSQSDVNGWLLVEDTSVDIIGRTF